MNLFGFNISRSQPNQRKSIDPNLAAWLKGENLDDNSTALTNAYQQVAWVHSIVNVLAQQVANIPFLFSAGDRGRENLNEVPSLSPGVAPLTALCGATLGRPKK